VSPVTIAEGILGLEGIHRVIGSGETVDMNVQGVLPRVKLDRITGLHALNEVEDNREPNYARSGETVFVSTNRGRTITYEGRVIGRTLPELRALSQSLRAAASSMRRLDGEVEVRPNAGVGGVTHRYRARAIGFEMDDEQARPRTAVPTPWQREFILTFRQGDPRFYVVGADVTVGGAAGEVKAVDNPTSAGALPVFVVNGPIPDDLVFERFDNFVYRNLTYDEVGLAAGQQLRLDFTERTLRRVSDDVSFEHKRVFNDSNWWDAGAAGLNPGVTTLTVRGGGNWTITFSPANF